MSVGKTGSGDYAQNTARYAKRLTRRKGKGVC